MEGEPLSSQGRRPARPLPGPGRSTGSPCVGRRAAAPADSCSPSAPRSRPEPVQHAARGTRVEVLALPGGFVAGQESALVNQLDGRGVIPLTRWCPVFRRGVDGRPTLVLNAETLAQLALLARIRRRNGSAASETPSDPGTFLATISGIEPDRAARIRASSRSRAELRCARCPPRGRHRARPRRGRPGRRLPRCLGPGHGARRAADRPTSRLRGHPRGRRAPRARPGRLPAAAWRRPSPLPRRAERPAVRALRQRAAADGGDAAPTGRRREPRRHSSPRWSACAGWCDGRGACAHPDGTARFVASTMRVFADHVEDHLEGDCHARAR